MFIFHPYITSFSCRQFSKIVHNWRVEKTTNWKKCWSGILERFFCTKPENKNTEGWYPKKPLMCKIIFCTKCDKFELWDYEIERENQWWCFVNWSYLRVGAHCNPFRASVILSVTVNRSMQTPGYLLIFNAKDSFPYALLLLNSPFKARKILGWTNSKSLEIIESIEKLPWQRTNLQSNGHGPINSLLL